MHTKHTKRTKVTPSLKSDHDRDFWAVCLHESGHLAAHIHFNESGTASAKIGYSPAYNSFFGACAGSIANEISHLVMTACGREAERYRDRLRPLPERVVEPEQSPATIEGDAETTAPARWATDPARFEKQVLSLERDDAHLAKGIADIYHRYEEIRYFARTHRRIRARARLLLRQNLPLLHKIASELYYNRMYVHLPPASAEGQAGI